MQANQLVRRTARWFTTGKVLGAATVALTLTGLRASASEPVIVLAMARPATVTAKSPATKVTFQATEPVRSSTALIHPLITPETSPLKVEVETTAFQNAHLEKQAAQHEPLVLVRESLTANRSVCVAAGYGRLWNDESMIKHLSPDRQEPGCAYIKTSFSF